MRVLLARPFVDCTVGVSPPLSVMFLSSYLKSRNIEAGILDYCIERSTLGPLRRGNPRFDRFLGEIRSARPDLLGMTLFSRELGDFRSLCGILREEMPGVRIVLGGPHPTAMPQETLEQIPACDVVVRGEGEVILFELVEALREGRALDTVPGVSFRNGDGTIHHGPPGETLADLDALPFPDREAVMQRYRDRSYSSLIYGSPSDSVVTSRGCPYNCRFCFQVCEGYRVRSPESVLEEIDRLVRDIRPQSIQFMDDSFTIRKDRVDAILEGLIRRRTSVKFKVRSRVNTVDEPMLRKMKRAGVDTIVYGLESGSQEMLDAFDKRATVEQNIRACRMAREAGLHCLGNMILFYPGESRESLRATERMIRAARPTAVKFYVLSPLPETAVYREAKANGKLVEDWGPAGGTPWIRLNGFGGLEEMQAIAKRMYLRTLLSPRRAAGILGAYGLSMLRNPRLAARILWSNVAKKMKY